MLASDENQKQVNFIYYSIPAIAFPLFIIRRYVGAWPQLKINLTGGLIRARTPGASPGG